MSTQDRKTVEQIRNLENSYCNPRKLQEASELRQDLRERGYSEREISRMVNNDD